jgi:hypothetical protein
VQERTSPSGVSVPQFPVSSFNSASRVFEAAGGNAVALFFFFNARHKSFVG